MNSSTQKPLQQTALHGLHLKFGARLVPFASYEMPIHYELGVMGEHLWTRKNAGLFDVSHMGQALLIGPNHEELARALERLVPTDLLTMPRGKIRYSQLLNPQGGIIDDLMIARSPLEKDDGTLSLVVNASRKEVDYAWLAAQLPSSMRLLRHEHKALLALQGPKSAQILEKHIPKISDLHFMSQLKTVWQNKPLNIARSGYTGEDGFEISLDGEWAQEFAELLLQDSDLQLIGLGARDSLRLEAGLCLYGNDIDETTSPVEAALLWSIPKRRREAADFIGSDRVCREIAEGPKRKRVGLKPSSRAPARAGTEVLNAQERRIGIVTSGGFGPSINGPVAMAYVESAHSAKETPLILSVRDKSLPALVADLPFVPHSYKR